MTYRNDNDALNTRKTQLEQQVAELRAAIAKGTEASKNVGDTVKALEEVYAELNAYAQKTTNKRSLPMLPNVYVASPCNVPWESMTGDERVRHCSSCDRNVYDLSSMSTEDAKKVLECDDVCAQFYRRSDGTILTADCPVGVEKKRKNRRKAVVIAATIASTVAASAFAAASMMRRETDEPETCTSSTKPLPNTQTLNVSTQPIPTQHNPTPQNSVDPTPVIQRVIEPVQPPSNEHHMIRGRMRAWPRNGG